MNKKLQIFLQILILLFISCVLPAGAQDPAQQSAANSLPGAWQRQSESDGQLYVMTFQPNGTGTLQSGDETSSFRWSVKDNTLTMDGDGRLFLVKIVITADTLTMTGENMPTPAVWHRQQTQTQSPQGNTPAGQPQINEQNPTGLIGTWKNSEHMMQFKADGTAILDAERYKYTANSSTITFTGYDGSIQLSYKLSGDILNLTFNGNVLTLNRSLP